MQIGTIISGGAHTALIGMAFLGSFDLWPSDPPELRVTEVTLIRAELFDTVTSSAPVIPLLDLEVPELPDAEFDAPVVPQADDAPVETEMDETAEPEEADENPDLTALLDVEQPDVSNVLDTVVAPSFDEAAPSLFQPAQDGNELNAPPSSISAPIPRNAPRIDTSAAERPPENALPGLETTTAVEDGPAEIIEEQQQDASAAPESSTEITPEGQENVAISLYAPVTAAKPPRRPRNLRVIVEEPESDLQEDPVLAAIEQAEREAAQAAAQQPVLAEMSGQETASIVSAFSPFWNKANLIGQPGFEQYVVIIEFNVTSTGVVERPVEPYEPSNPQGLFRIAYDSARRAVLQAGTIPINSAKFPDGLRIRLRFDPASGEIGLN